MKIIKNGYSWCAKTNTLILWMKKITNMINKNFRCVSRPSLALPQLFVLLLPSSTDRKVYGASTRVLFPSGADRSLTQWWSLPALSVPWRPFTCMWCPSPVTSAPRMNSWLSPLLLVTLLVCSVPSSPTLLTPSSPSWTRIRDPQLWVLQRILAWQVG